MEATFVRNLTEAFRGDARLYKLTETLKTYEDEPYDHIIISAADVFTSGPETYIFAADADGEVVNWMELPGSFRGSFDHDRALQGFIEKMSVDFTEETWTVVVLNDGETFTNLEGCVVLDIPGDVLEYGDVDQYVKDNYQKGDPVR